MKLPNWLICKKGKQNERTVWCCFGLAVIGIWIAAVVGWIMNIVAFVQTLPLFDTLQIARAAGIVLAPLGSILGLFA